MSAAKILVFAIGTETTPWPIICMFCKKVEKSRRKRQYTRFSTFNFTDHARAKVCKQFCVGSCCL